MSTCFTKTGSVARAALVVCLGLFAIANAPGATRWGLLVGINDYAPGYASSLRCCVNDVVGIRSTMMLGDARGRWPAANIQVLTNSFASKTSIRSSFQGLASKAGPGDVVVYYHSSHGGQDVGTSTYLCAYNTDYTDEEMGVDLARFDSSVSVVVILDTCHSGGMFKSKSWAFAENAMASFRAEKARQLRDAGLPVPKALGGNIAFMTACDYDELSWESPPHGFFTGAILRGCLEVSVDANGDGELQFMELFNYAAAETAVDQTAQCLNAELLSGIPALAAPGSSGVEDDAYEENDTRVTAFDLTSQKNIWLSNFKGLGVQADHDWFKITAKSGYLRILVECKFTHADGNIDIALVDSSGNRLATSAGVADTENIDFVVPSAGIYYIQVHGNNAGNTYNLRWKDALDSFKPDLVIGSITHSPINPVENDVVVFTITVRNQGRGAAAGVFNVAFWPDSASEPTISTPSALNQDYNRGIPPGQVATLQFETTALAIGSYTAWAYADRYQGMSEIAEENEANNAGPLPLGYTWSVDDRYEPNNDQASAFDLSDSEGEWLSAIDGVAVQGDDDWYRVDVGADVERLMAECDFAHAEGDINLALYDSAGVRVALSAGLSDGEAIDFLVPAAGTYYLCVVGANARNAYDLRWETTLIPQVAPVYRFWSDRNNGHFFTISEAEKDNIIATFSRDWRYEGVAYYAYPILVPGTVPLYRFWSDRYRGHFFTISAAEKNLIIANLASDWRYEGVAYYVHSDADVGRTPAYRFWSNRYKHHFFTINEAEKNNIIANLANDWRYEGIAYYVPNMNLPKTSEAMPAAAASAEDDAAFADAALVDKAPAPCGTASAKVLDNAATVFPLSFADGPVTASVYDASTGEEAALLSGAESATKVSVADVAEGRKYRLEVVVDDSAADVVRVVHSSTFERRADAPDGLAEAAAALADAGTPVGNPVERFVAPAEGGPFTFSLWSAARGTVETVEGVVGGEVVEFAIPDWNAWHWVSGTRETDDELVLSIWIRHEVE
ncbi:MAG: pre-peptidase C-terminal domain-containing protein [Kiritimatiellia bacterium]